LYVDPSIQDVPAVVYESCRQLEIARKQVVWFHPDFAEAIDQRYAQQGDFAERTEMWETEEWPESSEYEPIDCFQQALQIYTKKDFPEYWVILQHHLGLAFSQRSRGDRVENLEKSIECLNNSLQVVLIQKELPSKLEVAQYDSNQSLQSLDAQNEDQTAAGKGLGEWALPTTSGVIMSGVGQESHQPRQFWLAADAELIVYGATEPDAAVFIGSRQIPLNPDGTFRFHMSFQDGLIDYPIVAVAKDGEQQRSIHMKFERETPSRNTNTKKEAVQEWFA
jgi:hypothetical protein